MQPDNMQRSDEGGSANHGAAAPQNAISRPFTLQESLPYSPQTSTVPFVSGEPTTVSLLDIPTLLWPICFPLLYRGASSRPLHVGKPLTLLIPLEIIPDPSLGLGSPAPSISDLFPHSEYERLNKEALGQPHLPRSTKQAVDLVLHEIKPSQRTQ